MVPDIFMEDGSHGQLPEHTTFAAMLTAALPAAHAVLASGTRQTGFIACEGFIVSSSTWEAGGEVDNEICVEYLGFQLRQ